MVSIGVRRVLFEIALAMLEALPGRAGGVGRGGIDRFVAACVSFCMRLRCLPWMDPRANEDRSAIAFGAKQANMDSFSRVDVSDYLPIDEVGDFEVRRISKEAMEWLLWE